MYKTYTTPMGQLMIVKPDGSVFPDGAMDNADYQAYLKWLAEGNTPEPAEEQ